ncbi:hypothetical protein OLMES_3302 [Oleiphilus messinensis]|uniref:Uncharacterized protein n=1 Tax=Oleiphilus messinensis TaxID=141451 RepID=A0A1Y0ID87_9GAMM|nr:hypothetical protein [Oleiphilus messinensis]ARU57343.1 hypothetical protein OLMES_3302 [Oleiphilus messinensis]
MNRELFLQVTSWRESPIDGDERKSLKWIEVVTLGSLGLILGISCNGNWVRMGKESVYEFYSDQSYMPLYPILEAVLLDVKMAIKKGLQSSQLPVELIESFPFQEVALSAMNSGSVYWCDLSLKYVERLRYDEELVNALNICSKNAPTQKLRHQAKKIKANVSRGLSL